MAKNSLVENAQTVNIRLLKSALRMKLSNKNIHTGEKVTNDGDFTKHIRVLGNDSQCTICQKKLTNKWILAAHMRVHTREKPFKCTICQKKFTSKNSLIYHTRVHTGERPFACTFCEKKFINEFYLNTHLKVHSEEKPFECTICQKKFTEKRNLTSHVKTHTGKKLFTCNTCRKKFTNKRNFTNHMRLHTEECNICQKKIINKRVHKSEKPHCTVCLETIVPRSQLTPQIDVHMEKKPFECLTEHKPAQHIELQNIQELYEGELSHPDPPVDFIGDQTIMKEEVEPDKSRVLDWKNTQEFKEDIFAPMGSSTKTENLQSECKIAIEYPKLLPFEDVYIFSVKMENEETNEVYS